MLWPDKETEIDYLNFTYLVDMVVNLSTNRDLSPSTIGLYGDWGSGKSSLMKLAKKAIESKEKKTKKEESKILCIDFNGWLFEGYDDAKTSLCGTILDALADEKRFGEEVAEYAKDLLKKVDFKKIIGKGVKYGLDFLLTGGIGALTDLTLSSVLSSVKNAAGEVEAKQIEDLIGKLKKEDNKREEVKKFRSEFEKLLEMSKLDHVVVFIDELDRCQPDTILEVFEAMRLFLFVEGTSFVIGADERLIQYAIKSKYKEVPGNNLDIGKEYLEKVIQYPISIPQLNLAEVNQYLFCLLSEKTLTDKKQFNSLVGIISSLQPDQELTLDFIEEKDPALVEVCRHDMSLSRQISSVLAPSINGNPRQCKRFLNMLYMRMELAKARRINLDKNILAKLMLAEYFNPEFFKAITNPDFREVFKAFERGEELMEGNPFDLWRDKEWVRRWLENGTTIGDEKLENYVYFANIKNRYGHSNLKQLSPTARKCYEYLVDGTATNRNEALKLVEGISPGEKLVIANEIFAVIEISSELNVEILRSYADFSVKAGLIEEAIHKMMQLPVDKFNGIAYGQLTPFMNKLSPEEAKIFKDYLSGNPQVKSAIGRGEKLREAIAKR